MSDATKKIMSDIDRELEEHNKRIREMNAKNKQLGDGVIPGKVFDTPVADGAAFYEVVKTDADTTEIKHRPNLSLDEYTDHVLAGGGYFPTELIARLMKRTDALYRIFG